MGSLFTATPRRLVAALLGLQLPLVLGFLLVVRELHLVRGDLFIVQIAGIRPFHFPQDLCEDVLCMVDRVEYLHSDLYPQLVDLVFGDETNSIQWTADVAQSLRHSAEDYSIFAA